MSVNTQALDPKHELSEAKDTFKDMFEKAYNNNNHIDINGITPPSLKNQPRHHLMCLSNLEECLVVYNFL